MERKKITFFEGLFAVVVIPVIGVATTFFQPIVKEFHQLICTLGFYLLEVLVLLIFLMAYFKTNYFA